MKKSETVVKYAVKELKLRPTNDWYSNSSWCECNSMENPYQTHVCKKVTRAKKNSPCRSGQGSRAALPCDGLCFITKHVENVDDAIIRI